MGWLKDLLAPENLLALLGVVVTVGVLSYERLIPGRKRIGYRIQMDTVIDATDEDGSELHQRLALLEQLPDLAGASLVLVRIENDGFRGIDAGDYITAPEENHGLTVKFPGRTVRDVAVTEPRASAPAAAAAPAPAPAPAPASAFRAAGFADTAEAVDGDRVVGEGARVVE